MQKLKLISSLLAIIIITAIAGCAGKEDIKGVIDSWNKVIEKEYQIDKVLVDNAALRSNTLDEWVQNQQNTIGKLELLLQEEDRLISDFAGSTVKVTGDANKYANEALINIRETYKYRGEELANFKELVKAKQTNNDQVYIEKENQLVTARSKIQEYSTKANDAIKKLEALQK